MLFSIAMCGKVILKYKDLQTVLKNKCLIIFIMLIKSLLVLLPALLLEVAELTLILLGGFGFVKIGANW